MADDGTKYDHFELLVGRHRGLIRKLCWWRASGDTLLCDDLVQECYLAIWQHLASLRPGYHPTLEESIEEQVLKMLE